MMIPPWVARQFCARFTVVGAMIGMGFCCVTLTGHVRGSGRAILEPRRIPPTLKQEIALAKKSRMHALGVALSPPAFDPKYRLGFLEFETDQE
jgi:hypothetical protein